MGSQSIPQFSTPEALALKPLKPQSNDGTVAVKSNPIINKLFIILKTRKIYSYHTPNNDMAPNSANRTLNSGWSAIHDIFI